MHYWLIIWILTPAGQTLFDLEFDSLVDCQKALLMTVVLQKKKKRPEEELMLSCRSYPMDSFDWDLVRT